MLISTLVALALSAPVAVAPDSTAISAARVTAGDHGKLPWFQGSFEELLAAAKKENKPVFIDFWADWCVWCKRLEKDTFTDDGVVDEMKDFLVAHVDVESATGKPVAQRYAVGPLPTLMFLNPDGTVRDVLLGYLKPKEFRVAVARIRRDQGTLNDLRRQVEAAPKDVDKRIALANKLKETGDLKSFEEQVAAVLATDPERKDPKVAKFAYDALMTRVEALWQQGKTDGLPAMIQAHLEQEKDPTVLFRGFATLASIHEELGRMAEQKGQKEVAAKHVAEARRATQEAWKHVPDDQLVRFGHQFARMLWQGRAEASAEDQALALEVARKLQDPAEEAKDLDALETVASIYFWNGKKDEAIAVLRKALVIDPNHEGISDRLKEFGG